MRKLRLSKVDGRKRESKVPNWKEKGGKIKLKSYVIAVSASGNNGPVNDLIIIFHLFLGHVSRRGWCAANLPFPMTGIEKG